MRVPSSFPHACLRLLRNVWDLPQGEMLSRYPHVLACSYDGVQALTTLLAHPYWWHTGDGELPS